MGWFDVIVVVVIIGNFDVLSGFNCGLHRGFVVAGQRSDTSGTIGAVSGNGSRRRRGHRN